MIGVLAQGLVGGEPLTLREIVTGIGSLAVAVLGFLGVVYTARSSRTANKRTSDIDGWNKLVVNLQADVDAVRADRDEDRGRHKQEMAELRADLDSVKAQASEDREARLALVRWARQVVTILREAGIAFPQPPPGVADSGGHRAQRPSSGA